MTHVVLVLGGARSGKSDVAERLIGDAPATYVATGLPGVGDDDGWAARVAAHRERRPAGWSTVEAVGDLPAVLRQVTGTALVDSLGAWLARAQGFDAGTDELLSSLRARDGDTVVVSDEVGLGVHPSTAVGQAFRDALGDLNRAVAEVADEVLLVVAGRVLPLR